MESIELMTESCEGIEHTHLKDKVEIIIPELLNFSKVLSSENHNLIDIGKYQSSDIDFPSNLRCRYVKQDGQVQYYTERVNVEGELDLNTSSTTIRNAEELLSLTAVCSSHKSIKQPISKALSERIPRDPSLLSMNFAKGKENRSKESIGDKIFVNSKIKIDAGTQTNFPACEFPALNIFFCTFHRDSTVETYCNLASQTPKNVYNSCNEDDNWLLYNKRKVIHRETFNRGIPVQEVEQISSNGYRTKEAVVPKSDGKRNPHHKGRTLKKLHNRSIFGLKNKRSKSNMLKCVHCSEQFPTFSRLQKHTKLVHNSMEFSFPCDHCSATFTRPHNLKRHVECKHGNGEKKFTCEYCNRRFSRHDVLASHNLVVHSKVLARWTECEQGKRQIYECSHCSKVFTRSQNFKNHQEGNSRCSKCSESFPCKTNLKIHLMKNHAVVCEKCGKTCANRQQLYVHKLSHSPKYMCKFCGKGFVWEPQYIVHLSTHTGIKPLNCEICGKSFAHKNAVKKHMWLEHTESNKKYICSICGKGFVMKSKLESHSRIHSGDKPYSCHICSSLFSHNCNLVTHMKNVHEICLDSRTKKKSKQTSKKFEKNVVQNDQVVKRVPSSRFQKIKPKPSIVESKDNQPAPITSEITSPNPKECVYQVIYAYPT